MTIDERIERLTARVEGLVMTAELHQRELHGDAEKIRALATTAELHQRELQTDAENIRALARIAEIHEPRLEAIEDSKS